MRTDLFNPVATAGFSKFADILSATLSQHHILGFEIAQLAILSLPCSGPRFCDSFLSPQGLACVFGEEGEVAVVSGV